ncbi:MAG: molybdopterin molybdenumtransferase MoeA, partial [Thermoprotei archaeon]
DYRKGEILIGRKRVLKPWDLGIIASSGYRYIRVYERLRIGIFSTGSEIVEPGNPRRPGEIYNSTGVLVKAYLDGLRFVATRYYGVYPDDRRAVENILDKALRDNHVVVVTGGAGVSKADVVRDVVSSSGEFVFRGIAIRPGRPTSLAVVDQKPVFMLSGYPVAAWTALEAVVVPAIYRSLELEPPVKPSVKAKLARRVPNTIGYRSFIRVSVWRKHGRYYAEPYMLRGSGVLSSLVRTNGYIVLDENSEGYEKGEEVTVYLHSSIV